MWLGRVLIWEEAKTKFGSLLLGYRDEAPAQTSAELGDHSALTIIHLCQELYRAYFTFQTLLATQQSKIWVGKVKSRREISGSYTGWINSTGNRTAERFQSYALYLRYTLPALTSKRFRGAMQKPVNTGIGRAITAAGQNKVSPSVFCLPLRVCIHCYGRGSKKAKEKEEYESNSEDSTSSTKWNSSFFTEEKSLCLLEKWYLIISNNRLGTICETLRTAWKSELSAQHPVRVLWFSGQISLK